MKVTDEDRKIMVKDIRNLADDIEAGRVVGYGVAFIGNDRSSASMIAGLIGTPLLGELDVLKYRIVRQVDAAGRPHVFGETAE